MQTYLYMNLLIVAGFASMQLFALFFKAFGRRASDRIVLNTNYVLMGACLMIPFVVLVIPAESVTIVKSFAPEVSVTQPLTDLMTDLPTLKQADIMIQRHGSWLEFFMVNFILASLYHISRFVRGRRYLKRLYQSSHKIRLIRGIEFRVSDAVSVPLAIHRQRYSVILPEWMLTDPESFRLAIRHEYFHIKHGDLIYNYLYHVLVWLLPLNPFLWLWNRHVCSLQEYVCDEAVVGRDKSSLLAYSRCLLQVAEQSLNHKLPLVGATSMAASGSAKLLKGRIAMMWLPSSTFMSKHVRFVALLGSCAAFASLAFAAAGPMQERQFELAEVQKLADSIESKDESPFPIEVNVPILKQLNKFAGTVSGREYMRASLKRMNQYDQLLDQKLKQYDHPEELLAVGVMESGFRNLPEHMNVNRSTGIWQFIPGTAKRYGLTVNKKVDERLNVDKATDAAFRYLATLHGMFKDWRLAVLAYNAGEGRITKCLERHQTNDPWVLVKNNCVGDKNYLARVMAAALIMKKQDELL